MYSHLLPISQTIQLRQTNMQGIAGEEETNSWVRSSHGLPHVDIPMYISSSWSSYLCSSMWSNPQEYITWEFVLTSPAASCTSGSFNLGSFLVGGRWLYSCCFVGCCLQDWLYIYIYIYIHTYRQTHNL